MTTALAILAAIDPKLFYALVAGVTWLLLYLWRRVSIASWDAVTKKSPVLQQLPALFLSALLSAAPAFGKPMLDVIQQVLLGVLFGGGGAAAVHNLLAASPLPYAGGRPAPAPLFPPEGAMPAGERRTPTTQPLGTLQ